MDIKEGDICYHDDTGTLRVMRRWSLRWCVTRVHFKLIDVLDWFRALPLWWEHNKAAFHHGMESPGCVHTDPACVERRFDPVRGFHYYCTVCLRPVATR